MHSFPFLYCRQEKGQAREPRPLHPQDVPEGRQRHPRAQEPTGAGPVKDLVSTYKVFLRVNEDSFRISILAVCETVLFPRACERAMPLFGKGGRARG